MTTDAESPEGKAGLVYAIDLVGIMRSVWRRKLVLFATVALFFALAVVYLHVVHFQYSVILQVTAVEDQGKSIGGNLSNLASAAGIDLPGATSNRLDTFELFLQNIYSRETATSLANDQKLMQAMFPSEWDAANHRWQEPSSLTHCFSSWIKAILGIPQTEWQPPDGARVQSVIARTVQISRDFKNPIVTVQMDYERPEVALYFLYRLHQVDDGRLRSLTLSRSSKYIEYLNGELARVQNEDYRKALIDLLSDQEKRRMFASSSAIAYAAQPFGVPTASPLPTKPSAVVVLVVSVLLGILFGGFAAYVWDNLEQRRRTARLSIAVQG